MNRRISLVLLVLSVVALVGVPGALAIPDFLNAFNATYPSAVGTRIDACLLCHLDPNPLLSGNSTRNPYGLDFDNASHNFTAIEPFDSDGDGFINIDEIHNLTFPGNASDHPTVIVAANGTIAGNVTNASNGSAISGATVTANGMMATTDANGSYSINLTASTYNVTASATGYQSNTTTGVVVTSGNVTTQNFALTPTVAPVIVPVLTTIMVSPSTATLNVNGTQNFTATALDQNSTLMAGVNITWMVSDSTVGNVSALNTVTGMDGNATTTFMALAAGNATVNAMNGTVSGNATVNVTNVTTNVTVPTPELTLTLNSTMDGTSPPLVSNITSAVLLNTSGAQVETATLLDNMTAQFNLSGISPGDYFIEVNGLVGDHLPTRIDSNASDINQTVGLRLRNSVIGNISNPTYRIKVYASGTPPVVNSSHPVVNYATGANESIYNFVIVPGNTSRIEVRALNTSEELSNFTPTSDTHPAGANFSSEPFQIWILGDVINSTTGAFIGNHGHLYNNTDSNCNTCHGNLSTKASAFSDITPSNGWCFRCHYGKTGPRNGFVDPRVVAAANGTIAGNVTNASNGSAISGATVTANGMMATTDANGSYSINLTADTYNVTASATGFQANTTTGVVVTAGNVTTQDFALTPTAPIVTGPQLVLTLNASSSGSKASNFTSAALFDKAGAIVESASSISADGLTTTFNLTGIMPDFYFIEVNGLSGDRVPTFIDNNATNISQLVTKGLTTTTVGDATNPAKYRIKARSGGRHPIVNYFTGANETGLPFVIVYNDTSPGKIEVREVNTSRLLTNFTPSSLSNTIHASLQAGTTFQSWQLNLGASLPGFTGLLNHGQIYNNTDSKCTGCHGTNMNTKPANYSDVGTNFTSGANSGGSGWCFKCHYGGANGGDTNGFVDPTVIVAANGTIAGNVTNASSGMAIPGATITANGMMATTDANGSYSINLTADTYNMTASATGFQTNTTTGVVVTSGNVTTQDFALIPTVAPTAAPTFNISGFKINNATGNGIQDWNITLMNSTMQKSMLTDMNGSYMFTGLVNGSYNVSEEMQPGFTPVGATLQPVTINGSDVTNVNFTNNPISAAANRTFVADLTGSEEVPPEVTLARANATFNLSDDGTVLQFKVTVANITNATASHIHLAPVGVNGSIVVNLFTGPTKVGRFDGVLAEGNITQANLTGPLAGQPFSALLDNMTNGNTYVNIHTTQHPAGEIRGQIRVAPVPNARFSISGFKINNATGSGIQDWNITLRNGTTNALIDSKPTDANGSYQFIVLVNGSYNVSEEMRPGFTSINATSMPVTIENMDVMNVNFTNQATVTPPPSNATFNISGFKINNVTGNGVPGWNITLMNSTMSTSMLTGMDGSYMFTNLANGTYNVTEGMMAGWTNVSPMSQQVTIAGSDMMNVNFTNQPPSNVTPPNVTVPTFNISGFKINNVTGSGVPGWNITLMNSTMSTSMLTGMDGSYMFTNLANGTYNVTEGMMAGWTNVSPMSQQVIINDADMMNVNFTNQPPPTAVTFNISGFKINDTNGNGVWDTGETGIENWNINLLNATGVLIDRQSTDATGFYQFMDVAPGVYNVTEEMKPGFTPTNATSMPVTVENMDVMNVNFTNQVIVTPSPQAKFNISGFKINGTNNNGMGIANWNIMLLNDTGAQIASTMTDNMGFYNFAGLTNGTYNVIEGMMAGWTNVSPMSRMVVINGDDVPDVNFTNMLLPPTPAAKFSISGFKVNDTDGDGMWDHGEMGIAGWNIMLLDDKGAQIASTSTNDSGFYEFTNLTPGTYNVTEEMKEGFTPTSATSKMVTIQDMNVTDVNFLNMMVTPTPPSPPPTFTISGFKVNDTDGDGMWDHGEMGIAGWNIMLLDDKGAQIASTSTNDSGFYEFTNLTPGTYNVTEEMKAGFTPTSATSKMVTIQDMDVTDVDFLNMVTPTPPPQATFNISGFKVNDTDGDGMWDHGEMGIAGWNIMLLDDKGTQIASTSTNSQGFYEFMNLAPGTYKVTEEMKEGFTPSSATSKEVTIKDMDIMDVNFLNHVTVIPPPVVTNTISGFKINDLNGNGKQDPGENGLPGWKIKLTGIVGMGIETKAINLETTTNADGFYMFDNLPAGNYIVTEELQGGFVPVGSIVKNIILADGENSENNNFFNQPVESLIPDISGIVNQDKETMN